MIIDASKKGAQALRDFAQAMPVAVENIECSTRELLRMYDSVQDRVGPHNDRFQELLMRVKTMTEEINDAITILPCELEKVATMIDELVDS